MRRIIPCIACILLAGLLPCVSAARPIIPSDRIGVYPIVDGYFSANEWSNPQITIDSPIQTYVYFVNDEHQLYVMVDATGDSTDDSTDECLLVFDNGGIMRVLSISGLGGTVLSNDVYAVTRFSSSPNNGSNHKIYEWRIPLTYINAEPGQLIDFCSPFWKGIASMPFDGRTFRDNIWPENLVVGDKETWGILRIALAMPVGGEILPVNKLMLAFPLVMLIAAVLAISIVLLKKNS